MVTKNAAKGAKKGRRFGRSRSAQAKARCAARKVQRRSLQHAREIANAARREIGAPTPWEAAKAKRRSR